MFAVLKTGGKQYKVAKDDIIKVERLAGAAGDKIKLSDVLMVGDAKGTTIGDPLVKGTVVTAEILEQARADKIIVFKKKRRQGYRRRAGHRQDITVLKITDIGGGKAAAPEKAKAKAKAATKAATKADDGEKAAPAKAKAPAKEAKAKAPARKDVAPAKAKKAAAPKKKAPAAKSKKKDS